MSQPLVYDASALLAVVFSEAGSENVLDYLAQPGGAVSAVNWAEVGSKMAELGLDEATIARELETFSLDVVPFDESQALIAARLRPQTRHLGLSLGDRACLALGELRAATLITAERSWAELSKFKVAVVR